MTPLEKFIADSQRICDAVGNPTVADLMARTHQANESDTEHLYVLTAVALFPQALQHLRELSGEIELLKVHNRELRALAIERDTLSRRVAELEQRIADMQDEQRNPPTLRTARLDKWAGATDIDIRFGPNESLIPKEPKP